ncbi:MAG: hypothetical protein M0D57_04075 [Sphingobacteriales bacterium JAD_PAG50586_3]|nr:MAG: hypothetical protein M0D57_04075 [Sphingobacteriales bacterium JAD_PAG50586_3]
MCTKPLPIKITGIILLLLLSIWFSGCGKKETNGKYVIERSYKDSINSEAQYVLVIPERVSEKELKDIHQEFKESIGDTLYMFDYIYVLYYVSKVTDNGQWAFGEVYPGDSLTINGTTKEFFDKQVEKVNNDKRDIVGGWLMNMAGSVVTVLYKENNRYYIEQTMVDDHYTNGLLSYGDTIEVAIEKADTLWVIDTKNKNDERVKRQKTHKKCTFQSLVKWAFIALAIQLQKIWWFLKSSNTHRVSYNNMFRKRLLNQYCFVLLFLLHGFLCILYILLLTDYAITNTKIALQ